MGRAELRGLVIVELEVFYMSPQAFRSVISWYLTRRSMSRLLCRCSKTRRRICGGLENTDNKTLGELELDAW